MPFTDGDPRVELMMPAASLIVDHDFTIAAIDRRIFGSFAEHLGRCIYGGLYEPGHAQADANGFRRDVLALVKELGVSIVRYPGGNFVSNYRWEDGVGPRELRPRRRESAWLAIETNQFGTDEFIDWCRTAEVEPMLALNLGTRGVEAAGDYAEYCNHPHGTTLSDRRTANGHPQPHDVRLWCMGNEVDGPWQHGHKSASEYGKLVRESVKAMGLPDNNRSSTPMPAQEYIACGSSGRGMPSFGAWEREVLEECYDQVHYISLHTYYGCADGDRATFLARSHEMGSFIGEVVATCDAVKARRRSARTIYLSFDEWNVWYHSHSLDLKNPAWMVAPPQLEDVYDAADALVVGGMLITLLNHADRVKIACLAQLVNVIGPIMTRTGGPAWRQTIFHPFALASRYARGTVLRSTSASPTYACAAGKDIPYLDATVVRHDDGGVAIFVLNRHLSEALDFTCVLRSFAPLMLNNWHLLAETDLTATNTEAEPNRVVTRAGQGAVVAGNRLQASLPPASWSVFVLTLA